jgi:hypothetical protein
LLQAGIIIMLAYYVLKRNKVVYIVCIPDINKE